MNKGNVLLGIVAGVSAGAILGVLFAPGKGSSTRKKISQKSDEYLNELRGKFDEFIGGITEKFENAKEEAVRLVGNGKTKAEEAERNLISGGR
jgi:gas vesicle protein